MRRCGNDVRHARHGDCDGRGVNEPFEGQLTVAELQRRLREEQVNAMVCVELEVDGRKLTMPLAVPDPDRVKGKPLVILRPWKPEDWMPFYRSGVTSAESSVERCGLCSAELVDRSATHKVSEVAWPDPLDMTDSETGVVLGRAAILVRHEFTHYVCCPHFGAIMGPVAVRWCDSGHRDYGHVDVGSSDVR